MRILSSVIPTPEQLPILNDPKPGFMVIRGAGGSGKTTTALLRLRQLCRSRLKRRTREAATEAVRVLVLTYNKTLQGYITKLAQDQVAGDPGLILDVSTFSKWARDMVGDIRILDHNEIEAILRPLLKGILPSDSGLEYFIDEVEYVLSKFLPDDLEDYVGVKRIGHGTAPRVEAALRRRLLDEVIDPYLDEKDSRGFMDWNDLAIEAIDEPGFEYDVIIVDEAQDFEREPGARRTGPHGPGRLGDLCDRRDAAYLPAAIQLE